MHGKQITSYFVWLLAIISMSTSAEILHYTDKSGRKVYVDNIYKVPQQYRSQLLKKNYEQPEYSKEQRQQLTNDQSKLDQSFSIRRKLKKLEALKENLQTKVKIDRRQVIVPVTVAYRGKEKVYQLLLDTGATYSVIHTASIGKSALVGSEKGLAKIVGGTVLKVNGIYADKLSVGPHSFSQSRIAIVDSVKDDKIDGLLGMNVLSQLDYKIDYEREVLVWDHSEFDEVIERITALRDGIVKE